MSERAEQCPAPILRADALTFRYPNAARDAVRGVSIHLKRGEMLAVAGPNGSGKSTLVGLMIGFLRPSTGTVSLDCQTIGAVRRDEFARRVTAIPQGEVVLPGMTVRELVLLGRLPHAAGWLPIPSQVDEDAASAALDSVGITEFAGRRVETLSGGERQLARIARAIAQGAPLMLLDEPTAALDLAHQQQIMRLLRACCDRGANGVLVVSHDLNLVANWADRAVLMREGELAAEGAAADVMVEDRLRAVFGADLWVATTPDGAASVGLRR